MSDPEPQPDPPLSFDAAQPSSSAVTVPQPDQQPIEQEQSRRATPSLQQQEDNTDLDHPDQEHQQSLPPFQPLFTLVTDSTTGATHHAHVHYIFSDDEPDLLTDALGQYSILQHQQQQTTTSSSSGSTSAKPAPPQPPSNSRAILLDLVPNPPNPPIDPTTTTSSSSATAATAPTYDVAWASSLSADWAVVSAKVSPMSADDNDTEAIPTPARGADSDGGGLMLHIEGVDLTRPPAPAPPAPSRAARSKASIDLSSGSSSGVGQPAQQEDYGAIVDEFDKRMVVLRKVLEAGRERQVKMAVDAGGGETTGPQEAPAADVPGRPASHTSLGHDLPDNGPSAASRRPSNSSGVSGVGQQTGLKRLSGGSGGRAEWEQQPVG